jgi:hypothetical protein
VTDASMNLPGLAIAYRRLVLWYGAQLFVIFCFQIFQFLFRTATPPRRMGPITVITTEGGSGYSVLLMVLSAASLIILAGVVISAYRTAQALGSSSPVLWALAMVLPLVNLITLVALSLKARQVCREHGIPVGLFGPRPT